MTDQRHDFSLYRLEDRYTATTGRVHLTGTQALVRIMLDQARRDRRRGLKTAGLVSGYRGSPLGGLDREMWRARDLTEAHDIAFVPAVNEDLAAAIVLGAQQASFDPKRRVEGVFSMWYGKGPGVDRSGDGLRHGNAFGSSEKGGVLVVAGDDHGCVSSSMPHQSDVAFQAWFMPVLHPASVAEYLEFGEYGIALSRFTGLWVGFKAISETVESARSVELRPDRDFVLPEIALPPGGLHARPRDLPSPEIETRIARKLAALEAFVEANPIDRALFDLPKAPFGFVTTGKAHLDLMEALRLLGLDAAACRRLGIDIYKVGMVWPLARKAALGFVRGKREVMVVEEKRGLIEGQFKEYFYDWPGDKPERMVGKHRAAGDPLLPFTGELSPLALVEPVAERLDRFFPAEEFPARARRILARAPLEIRSPAPPRTPYFCSGCPHSTSTRLPAGSRAGSGIGCHVMASWMNRNTDGYAWMGAEGVPHVGAGPFTDGGHMFQNMGEGTWYHSGSLAVRQAVAQKANITFKILYNDAVAMTGGQPVDGPVSVAGIAHASRAEGVARIAVVSDDIGKYRRADFPKGTTFHPREELIPLQEELRALGGVSVLIHEQTCAAEKRRRRKRGLMADPPRFVVINPRVCEGCGDCAAASNCLSVEPIDTPFGRKRRINLSSCNKDYTCLDGFCPAMVTVETDASRPPAKPPANPAAALDPAALTRGLPAPELPPLDQPWNLLVTGVGGTGVVTVGAVIAMAAHLEGKGVSTLDFTGFAQKFGTVLSHLRLAARPAEINQVRIDRARADAVIGCDLVVTAGPRAAAHYGAATRMVLNTTPVPTGESVLDPDADPDHARLRQGLVQAFGPRLTDMVDAGRAAERLLRDAVFANMLMLGLAWQRGLVPVGRAALEQAIRLNGVRIDENLRAFHLGRVLAADPARLASHLPAEATPPEDTATLIRRLEDELSAYHDRAYGRRFTTRITAFARALAALPDSTRDELTALAARALFQMMAIKDEYEVARLYAETDFLDSLRARFGADARVRFHMAPPLLPLGRDHRGNPRKRAFGPWMRPALRLLSRMRRLRFTPLDPFGHTAERRAERALLAWFEGVLDQLAARRLGAGDHEDLRRILEAALKIRGFGPVRARAAARHKPRANAALARLVAAADRPALHAGG